MRSFKYTALALVCVVAPFLARPAQAIPTTTTGGTVLLGGTVVLVLYLAKVGPFEEKDAGAATAELSRQDAARLANAYLHELGPSLTEALAVGQGAVVDDWARALKLPREHAPRLGAALKQHHAELLTLSRLDGLTDARAEAFFLRLAEVINEDPVLKQDLQSLRASMI